MSNKLKGMKKKKLQSIKNGMKISFYGYVADYAGCGTIRVIYPYLLMNQYIDRVNQVKFESGYGNFFITDKEFYKRLFVLQFQRAATKDQLALFSAFKQNMARQTSTPLVYEIDDLLTAIPKWNFAHDFYNDKQEHIKNIMRIADGMTVSTLPLKKEYSKLNKNIKVIPNHLPKFAWGEIPVKVARDLKKPRIFWGGSGNHFGNKDAKGGDFGIELMDFIKKTTDKYQWVFMGALPQELDEVRDKIEFHDWVTTYNYGQYVKGLDIDLAIAPLEDNLFNRCKSNLKMLEFVAMGVPAVYSDVYPYKDALMVAETDGYMIDCIERLASSPSLREEVTDHDFEKVKDQLWWEDRNMLNLRRYVNSYLGMFDRKLP